MYGKEASNRKQEIDRQHRTIPNQRNQRPKDKHRGNVYNLLFRHRVWLFAACFNVFTSMSKSDWKCSVWVCMIALRDFNISTFSNFCMVQLLSKSCFLVFSAAFFGALIALWCWSECCRSCSSFWAQKKTHGLQFTVPCAFTLFY